MNKYFEISGYWKDDRTEFSGLIVKESYDVIEGEDDNIFYYGLDEAAINRIIKESKNGVENALDFGITEYKEVDYVQ
jgi:hypothetical protein